MSYTPRAKRGVLLSVSTSRPRLLSVQRAKDAPRHRVRALLASYSLIAGTLALASTQAMAQCASGDNVSFGQLLTSSSCQGTATEFEAVAVGFQAKANGIMATAVGEKAGRLAPAANGATIIGAHAGHTQAGHHSTAIGAGWTDINGVLAGAQAAGAYSIAIGGGDGATFEPSIGPDIVIQLNGARAVGFISTAIGTASRASGGGSSAFGLYSRATGDDSAAYGEFSTASGPRSVATGLFSEASGADSIASGSFSKASTASAVALGRNATASKNQSVAIGYNSIANVANTISIGRAGGERRIMNVATGVKPTDAVNVAQLQAAVAALASAVGTSAPAVAKPFTPEPPPVSVVAVKPDNAKYANEDIRRELAELRALVKQQQQRIVQLESKVVAAGK